MQNEQTPHKHAPLGQADNTALIQREFPYLEGQVILVLDQGGTCWVSIPSACKALGLNARGQQQRIGRTQELAQACRQLLLLTRGGPQRITCLQVKYVSVWLQTLTNALPEQHSDFLQIITDAATSLLEDVQPKSYQLLLPLDEEQAIEQQHAVVQTALPGLGPILVVPNHAEDRAIREATFAPQDDWQEEPHLGLPYYLASNQMRVYIGDPAFPLEQEEAQAALGHLRESTILAARYVLGRWNIAREQGQLAQEGSVPIRVEEILEWRGLQKHSRALYPGSSVRLIEGYEIKYRSQVHEDLKILGHLYLRGTHHVLVEEQWRPVNIDGFYLRTGRLQNPENDRELYYIAPGVWINTYELSGLWLAELDRRIFMLHPQRDQIALRIALFLSEHWQFQLMMGRNAATPLTMLELLNRSMVAVDQNHLTTRFIPRVEAALQRLLENGIVGEMRPENEISQNHTQWGKDWLAVRWSFIPSAELLQRYAQRVRARVINPGLQPILLSSPGASANADLQGQQGREILHTPFGLQKQSGMAKRKKKEEKQPDKPADTDLIASESVHDPFEESR